MEHCETNTQQQEKEESREQRVGEAKSGGKVRGKSDAPTPSLLDCVLAIESERRHTRAQLH